MNKNTILCTITAILFLTGCGTGSLESGNLQSSVLPTSSIGVSSTPAETLGTCTPVTNVTFQDASTIVTQEGTYSLLGLFTTEEFSENESRLKPALDTYAADIFCVKTDPLVEDTQMIYAFSGSNTLVNSEILRNGLAGARKDINFLYKDYFISLGEEAKTNKAGIYASEKTNMNLNLDSTYPEISPQDAKEREGDIVTLRMTVGSIGRSSTALYFNSEEDYTSPDNVAGVIALPAKNSILENLINTAQNYEGRSVRITGTIRMADGKPQILIEDHAQVEVTP